MEGKKLTNYATHSRTNSHNYLHSVLKFMYVQFYETNENYVGIGLSTLVEDAPSPKPTQSPSSSISKALNPTLHLTLT